MRIDWGPIDIPYATISNTISPSAIRSGFTRISDESGTDWLAGHQQAPDPFGMTCGADALNRKRPR
jgi:hypothetical protein